jgi:hypothetical protein
MSSELSVNATLQEMYLHFAENADNTETQGRPEWVYNKWGIRPDVVVKMRKDRALYNETTDLVHSREVKHGFDFNSIAGELFIFFFFFCRS